MFMDASYIKKFYNDICKNEHHCLGDFFLPQRLTLMGQIGALLTTSCGSPLTYVAKSMWTHKHYIYMCLFKN